MTLGLEIPDAAWRPARVLWMVPLTNHLVLQPRLNRDQKPITRESYGQGRFAYPDCAPIVVSEKPQYLPMAKKLLSRVISWQIPHREPHRSHKEHQAHPKDNPRASKKDVQPGREVKDLVVGVPTLLVVEHSHRQERKADRQPNLHSTTCILSMLIKFLFLNSENVADNNVHRWLGPLMIMNDSRAKVLPVTTL